MPAGIVSFGAYIPVYRLSIASISQVWGGASRPGEKAVANWDEDSLTMATEAILDCLSGVERSNIDALYLATTTPPYVEKQSASIIGMVIDARKDVAALDICDSIRGGTMALKAGLDSVKAGTAERCLIAAADCRLPAPDSEFERLLGDGAAAFLLGDSDLAVEVEDYYGVSSAFLDIWKRPGDAYVRAWEDRFNIEEGYLRMVPEVVSTLLGRHGMKPGDFAKAVLYAYDSRRHADLARLLGFSKEQVQDPLIGSIGHTGTASVPMMLVAALEGSNPGDRILLVNYGDGADASILRVTDRIHRLRTKRGIAKNLRSRMVLPSYGKYLHFRDLMQWQSQYQPPKYSSAAMSWRDREWILGCKGGRCRSCGKTMFPPQRVCSWCKAKDDFEYVRLSEQRGRLFSYSLDGLAASTDPPVVISIVDLDGGARFSTTMTDRDPDTVSTNMPVELTFRRVHDAKGIVNYFWKCRPVRD